MSSVHSNDSSSGDAARLGGHHRSGTSTPPTDLSDTDLPKATARAGARVSSSSTTQNFGDALEPIAIIGVSQNFPGDSDTPKKFWDLVVNARSALTEVPPERWNLEGFYSDNAAKYGVQKSRKAHFVTKDLSAFDAPFFSITAGEAMYMDPQQRWLLETTYHAFENAGLSLDGVANSRTSVFIGSFLQDYSRMLSKDQQRRATFGTTGNGAAMLANRLSWFYNLKGPSLALDTACSGSLIALHLACQSIRNGETDMGVIGACNLMLSPETFIALSDNGFLSKDGKSYSFDHRANGYSRGEGCGIVILKRLSDAIRDGNVVRAIVRGSGSNQDGRTLGITLPSSEAQRALITETYKAAGLPMSETGYFEAHGTGTPMGDPIEARAIAESFEGQISRDRPLCVGSLKPLIGHLENASGVASLIKAVLVLEKGIIPPCGHMEKINHEIEQHDWPIMFPTSAMMWPTRGLRRVSINSFGYGGANCHVVLDDAFNYGRQRDLDISHRTEVLGRPMKLADEITDGPRLLTFSASDKDGLQRTSKAYEQYLHDEKVVAGPQYLADLAFTLSQKRSQLSWRSSLVVPSSDEFSPDMLSRMSTPNHAPKQLNALFIFTGQGAQWAQMGQGLLSYRVFEQSIELSEEHLKGFGCRWSLSEELRASEASSRINEPEISQVLCTALQIALVDLLRHLRVEPEAVVGHSSGEIAAAYCAGFMCHSSAMKLAYSRGMASILAGKLVQEQLGMMAIAMGQEDAQDFIEGELDSSSAANVCVACINSPKNVTLSGPLESLEAIREKLEAREIFARVLRTGMAYHSPYMESIASVYEALIQGLEPELRFERKVVMFSSTTAKKVFPTDVLSPSFWVQNLVSPVRFSEALSQVFQGPGKSNVRKLGAQKSLAINFALEVGPHPALRSAVHETLQSARKDAKVAYSPTLQRTKGDMEAILLAAGLLYDHGSKIDILAVNQLDGLRDTLNLLDDLPAYPFNHSKQFWSEGRTSKAFNHRGHRPHELLGVRDSSSSAHEPKWKHNIAPDEQAWVKDHHVFGMDLYPAAGLLVMALEAARQLSDAEKPISTFLFQSVTISQALIVKPGQSGVETETSLKLLENTRGRAPTWYSFRICAFADQESYECCSGEVGIEYEHPASEVEGATTQQMLFSRRLQALKESEGTLPNQVSPDDFYNMIGDAGLQFGPSFRGIESLQCSEDPHLIAMATVNTLNWRDHVDDPDISSHIIHPAALDAILQPGNAAISHGKKELVPSMVPTRIPTFRIAAKACLDLENPRVKVHTSATSIGFRTASGRLFALQEEEQLLLVDGVVEFTTVDNPNVTMKDPFGRCYHIDWKPDFSLMTTKEVEQYCSPIVPADFREHYRKDIPLMQNVRLQAIYHAAPLFKENLQFEKKFEYMSHYITFLRRKLDEIGDEFQPCEDLNKYLDSVSDEVCQRPEGEVALRVARNLNSFLEGSADPLAVLFEDDLMARHYAEATSDPYFQQAMTNYLDLVSHKNPQIRVLEIGAGTGSVSNVAVEALGRNGDGKGDGSRFSCYCYTDISASFFEVAKEKFAIYSDRMEFKKLDIGTDPTTQGFEDESFDVIIAANVLHATPDLSATMDNVYRLLKPDGKLIMTDIMTPDSLRSSFVYGLFPGWWLSVEEERKESPLLSPEQWNDKAQKHGFSAVELSYESDPEGDFYLASVLVFSKPSEEPAPVSNESKVCIINSSQGSQLQQELAVQIKRYANEIEVQDCTILDLDSENWPDLSQHFCVFLPELDRSHLNNLSAASFQNLKSLLSRVSGILWVCGSDGTAPGDAFSGMSSGLSRVYRTENPGFKFVTLTIDRNSDAKSVTEKVFKTFHNTVSSVDEFCEDEIREAGSGLLHVGRLVQAKSVNQQIFSHSHRTAEPKPFRDESGRKIALTIETPGLAETLQFDDAPFAARKMPLRDTDVEVDIRAAGVNFRDILIATGQYDLNCFGWECVGTVREAGSAVSNIKVGDRITCMLAGAFANVGRCHGASAIKVPDNISDEVGASLPIVACTVVYAFQHVAQLTAGESVLIHSGAGGLGQMAIQMAKHIGAEIYVTVGSKEKKDFLHERYGIPLNHILYSRGLSFATALKGLTKGRGVDVILNSLGGQSLRETWKCIAPLGRFLEVGKKDALTFSKLPMEPFSESVTFACIDLAVVYTEKPALAGRLLQEAIDLVQAGHLSTPDPLHVYSGSEIEKAFRLLQEGKSIGKAVIKFNDDDLVPTVPSKIPDWNFDADVSYMITGGLGGLGQNMARWMVDRGARNLILISRRGKVDDKDAELLDEMRARGVSILTPSCDISNEESFKSTLELCREQMPPIKGCIQAAMVIRDERFQEMKYADLQASIASKVSGSLNLHKHLPHDLDFLVFLSSVSSIPGFEGQSNYAMGNVFQDQLARHRVSQGLKAVCIDLGIIYDAGFIANNATLKANMQKIGLFGLNLQNLLSALERYCDPRLPVLSPTECQPIMGYENMAQVALRGGEVDNSFKRPLFACMNQLSHADGLQAGGGDSGRGFDVQAALAKVKTLDEAVDLLVQGLTTKLSLMLGIDKEEIATDRPLHSYGVDSLVAIEVKNWFRKSLGADVSVLEILSNSSIAELAAIAVGKSSLLAPLRSTTATKEGES